ncbi:triosephosphate isomerase-like [Achroia grisella]|uniref:triosephosphate isomerase-like n=1 Tax=Achroia grisella TaxID=688607 RepID=UPI0027D2458A|nr:triosephosphate isomerase-like [Achroia grisella]XP_059055149.1 triosephosphate isomerase-like [Achroia grisella]
MSRTFIVCGNWKMNGDTEQTLDIIKNLTQLPLDPNVEIVLAIPSIYIAYVKTMVPYNVALAAQNCWRTAKGAFTGEISGPMIKDVGAEWVILGPSERRIIFKEDDDLIAAKVEHALESGLKVIACVGENQEQKDAGLTEEVVTKQIKALVPAIGNNWQKVVLAYEPVWAIGTGVSASPQQVQEVHAAIRSWLSTNVNSDVADSVRIQYGGSVTEANATELAACADVDGFLVGSASLKPEFVDIINSSYFI